MGIRYAEKNPNVGHFEGSTHSDSGFGGSMLAVIMVVAFLVIVLFFIFRRENNGVETLAPLLMNSGLLNRNNGDESVFEADKDLTNKIIGTEREVRDEAELTRTQIDNKFDRLNNRFDRMEDREFHVMLTENNALKAELNNRRSDLRTEEIGIRNARFLEAKIDKVDDMLLSGRGGRPRTVVVEDGCY